MTLFPIIEPITHVLVVHLRISMNGLSNAASSTLLEHQLQIGVSEKLQAKAGLLQTSLPSQSGRGVKVSGIQGIVF